MNIQIGCFTVLVDDEDAEKIGKYNWHHNSSKCGGPYFRGWVRDKSGKRIHVYLHRYILDAPREKHVDHINCDTLDNRKENLRLCSQLDNSHNLKISKRNTTGFKGVTYNKRERKYKAQICLDWKHIGLGTFKTAEEAYVAYCKAAVEYYGKFARLS